MDNLRGSRAYHSRISGDPIPGGDDDSDRAILEDGVHRRPGIMKSMTVTVEGASVEPERS